MKRIVLILIIWLPCICYAQFELTPNGFVDQNTKKDFVLREFPEKSALDLYNEALVSITSIYKAPNIVASKVEGEIININGSGTITVKRVMNFDYTINYNFILRFKDGRVRFDAPLVSSVYTFNGNRQKCYISLSGNDIQDLGFTIHIFKNNGKVKQEKIKKDIENYFNMIVDKIVNDINGNEKDDW